MPSFAESPAEVTTATADTPYDRLGGMPVFQRIADRFYDLMDQEPGYAELRAMHAPDLAAMRRALPQFLAGWAGGPRDWWEENPGKCMVSMHAPFAITREAARQWGDAMHRAIAEADAADAQVAEALAEVLTRMASGMARSPV